MQIILGLAGIDADKALESLKKDHTEAYPLVGKDLSPLIHAGAFNYEDAPVYFMTDDDVTKGENQTSISASTKSHINGYCKIVEEECQKKRLYPSSGNVSGKPTCQSCTPHFRI